MSFTENLKRIQEESGESNYRLAKEIDVSQTTIKNWRDGIRHPHPKNIKRIAKHYNVTVDDLLKKEE